ncbi:MAG: hypothetical protein PHV37_09975 [Candidatus Gastranaerophilales bacterium]|nr:hypothetical protein [Candidatus Gastranaerophilales bacterium]
MDDNQQLPEGQEPQEESMQIGDQNQEEYTAEKLPSEQDLIEQLIKSHSPETPQDAEKPKEEKAENSEDMQKVLDENNIEIAPKDYKKFVINVKKEYVDYFENLSTDSRSKLINGFLKSEIDNKAKNQRKKVVAKFLRHFLIILLTIVIGFPIIFFIVNSSIKSTINSYKYMQVNFERLYQQKAMEKY